MSDVSVGNFNIILMSGLVMAFFLARNMACHGISGEESRIPFRILVKAALLLTCLATLALLKPPMAAYFMAFSLFLVARFGMASALKSALLALIPVGAVATLPMLRFGSWTIWMDWIHYFKTGNADMFNLAGTQGNVSTTLFLSKVFGVSLSISTGFIIVFLIATLSIAIMHRGKPRQTLLTCLTDPHFALSIGVTVSLGLSPLVWVHYYTLLPVSALLFLHPRYERTSATFWALLAILMASAALTPVLDKVFALLSLRPVSHFFVMMVSWFPLWVATLTSIPVLSPTHRAVPPDVAPLKTAPADPAGCVM
ncbi:MAG: hypothetical protein HQL64_00330 [Magnetococcales bacterium]|nr:hypothetical protein [Magnetococcales bacterium]